MRRFVFTVFLVAAACSEDLSVPPAPPLPGSGGGGCNVDADCSKGICDVNHSCIANGCRTDTQCSLGICINSSCDPNSCHANSQCASGFCVIANPNQPGRCGVVQCHQNGDCAAGQRCVTTPTGETFCEPGTCLNDSDCPGCGRCVYDAGSSACYPGTNPPLVGTATALKMTDNLTGAVNHVRTKHPTAMLIRVFGAGLSDAGTVNITRPNDYISRWGYGFQVGDGSMAPPQFVSVLYLLQGGSQCGLYSDNDGSLSKSTFIPDSTWQSYWDATALVSLFEAHPNCAAPAGTSSDVIVYTQQTSGPQFVIQNWKPQTWLGNPVTPDGGFFNCP